MSAFTQFLKQLHIWGFWTLDVKSRTLALKPRISLVTFIILNHMVCRTINIILELLMSNLDFLCQTFRISIDYEFTSYILKAWTIPTKCVVKLQGGIDSRHSTESVRAKIGYLLACHWLDEKWLVVIDSVMISGKWPKAEAAVESSKSPSLTLLLLSWWLWTIMTHRMQ